VQNVNDREEMRGAGVPAGECAGAGAAAVAMTEAGSVATSEAAGKLGQGIGAMSHFVGEEAATGVATGAVAADAKLEGASPLSQSGEHDCPSDSVAAPAPAPRASDAPGFERATPERTLSLTVSYNGEPFNGFAKQPGQCTVQGELEHALGLIFRREVPIVCSGRTDAGVHALGQVVSFDLTADELEERNLYKVRRSLNALTHEGITVREVAERDPGFSARFDARWREYHYHLCTDEVPPLFMRNFSWHVGGKLDVDAMQAGANYLVGHHDFKSFCMAASAVGKPTERNLMEVSFSEESIMGEQVLTVKVVGNAFLHSMVRTIVGTLVAVGKGQRSPEWVGEVLAARNRTAAGENAPAAGLVFWRVEY
jgi:tRNA pseudouridine38-40 synthase